MFAETDDGAHDATLGQLLQEERQEGNEEDAAKTISHGIARRGGRT